MTLDHIHMCISIPPKYAASNVVGYLKGKSAVSLLDLELAHKCAFISLFERFYC